MLTARKLAISFLCSVYVACAPILLSLHARALADPVSPVGTYMGVSDFFPAINMPQLDAITAWSGGAFATTDSNGNLQINGSILGLDKQGSLWGWGSNGDGILGSDPTQLAQTSSAIRIAGITNIKKVVISGGPSVVVLKNDGTVWTWGTGLNLGRENLPYVDSNGNSFDYVPRQVSGLPPVNDISSTYQHVLALAGDGSVYAWGADGVGQIGNDPAANRFSNNPPVYNPVKVLGLNNVVSVAAGASNSLAVTSQGQVYEWGMTDCSENTCNYFSDNSLPTLVNGVSDVKSVSAGLGLSLAITNSGDLYSWGTNYKGQLGFDPTNLPSSDGDQYSLSPVKADISHVASIFTSRYTVVAVDSNKSVFHWGVWLDYTNHSNSNIQYPVIDNRIINPTAVTASIGSITASLNSADTVPPSGSFTGSTLVLRLLKQTIKGIATDNVSVARVDITSNSGNKTLSSANGTVLLSCNAAKTSCTWTANPASLNLGIQTLTLKVTDVAGNVFTTTKSYTII